MECSTESPTKHDDEKLLSPSGAHNTSMDTESTKYTAYSPTGTMEFSPRDLMSPATAWSPRTDLGSPSSRMNMTQPMSAGPGMLQLLLSEAGCAESVKDYLVARGFTTVRLLSASANSEEAFVERIVRPFIDGHAGPDGDIRFGGDPDLLRAQMVVAWLDARQVCSFDNSELNVTRPKPLNRTAPLPEGLAPRNLTRQGSAPAGLGVSERLMAGGGRNRHLPAPARILKSMEAHKYISAGGHQIQYSMAQKLPSAGPKPQGGEFGPDVNEMLDQVLDKRPTWSMPGKGEGEKVRGAWVPAPGEYDNPSTMMKSHPVIPLTGRGWRMGTEKRKGFTSTSVAPAPNAYMYDIDNVKEKDPTWVMGGKLEYGSPLSAKKGGSKSMEYVAGMLVRGGSEQVPKWSLTKRPASTLCPTKPRAPGPGNYPGAGAFLTKTPSWSMGTSSRFGKAEVRGY
mmetsp:Transcript_20893/g.62278  ORF Transcript_20893/g.62278 Transcript_20893/m.62278 type:complete len:452 (-) Transcript_20893:541-1896(-)